MPSGSAIGIPRYGRHVVAAPGAIGTGTSILPASGDRSSVPERRSRDDRPRARPAPDRGRRGRRATKNDARRMVPASLGIERLVEDVGDQLIDAAPVVDV